jgi:hypothetical protein
MCNRDADGARVNGDLSDNGERDGGVEARGREDEFDVIGGF